MRGGKATQRPLPSCGVRPGVQGSSACRTKAKSGKPQRQHPFSISRQCDPTYCDQMCLCEAPQESINASTPPMGAAGHGRHHHHAAASPAEPCGLHSPPTQRPPGRCAKRWAVWLGKERRLACMRSAVCPALCVCKFLLPRSFVLMSCHSLAHSPPTCAGTIQLYTSCAPSL